MTFPPFSLRARSLWWVCSRSRRCFKLRTSISLELEVSSPVQLTGGGCPPAATCSPRRFSLVDLVCKSRGQSCSRHRSARRQLSVHLPPAQRARERSLSTHGGSLRGRQGLLGRPLQRHLPKMANGDYWTFPAEGFSGRGVVNGMAVRCLSPATQVLCHAHGYVPTENLRDMERLEERFKVELPPQLKRIST